MLYWRRGALSPPSLARAQRTRTARALFRSRARADLAHLGRLAAALGDGHAHLLHVPEHAEDRADQDEVRERARALAEAAAVSARLCRALELGRPLARRAERAAHEDEREDREEGLEREVRLVLRGEVCVNARGRDEEHDSEDRRAAGRRDRIAHGAIIG